MKPSQYRALSMLIASTSLATVAVSSEIGLRLLPTSGQLVGKDQSLTTRWTSATETENANTGTGVRATFSQNEAFVAANFTSQIDVNGYDGMYFLLKNTGNTVSQSSVELNSYLNGVEVGIFVVSIRLNPGETKRAVVYFDYDYAPKQMGVFPAKLNIPAQQLGVGGTWNFDRAKVKGWRMWNTGGPASVELQDLRLVKKRRDLSGLIDAYGQDADLDWPGKIKNDGDIASAAAVEANSLATLADAPTAPNSTQFGMSKATGKWRFERAVTGNWFAVNPQGGRTWIMGANHVYMDGKMIVANKEDMYQSLPSSESNFGQFYQNAPYFATGQWLRTFDMYRANLYKKFGQNYETEWRNRMKLRMRKWGINAASGTLDRGMVDSGMPYINHMVMHYFPVKLGVPRPYWSHPNDPFAPTFPSWCLSQFKQNYAYEIANNPSNHIGLAVGNEETWGFVADNTMAYQIPISALNADPSQPCKAPLVQVLKTKYTTIARLNTAWGKNYASWDSVMAAGALGTSTPTINTAMLTDFKLMLSAFADKYYSTIRAQLLKSGYKGLFLGSRDALDQTPDEVLRVQGKYVDAYTMNNYESDDKTWARIAQLTKPVIITEFAFSAVDRGHNAPNKNFEVGTQEDRAVRTREYLNKAASMKNVAGVFYYGYAECPFTGRWSDDERFNAGMVDITDTPYKELTDTFRNFGFALPSVRKVK